MTSAATVEELEQELEELEQRVQARRAELDERRFDPLREATARRAEAIAARDQADVEWQEQILSAHQAGATYDQIAEAAGVSKPRIGQILSARRATLALVTTERTPGQGD